MDLRQFKFLRLLLEQEGYQPVSFYASALQISDKTLRRSLPKMKALLASCGAALNSRQGSGITASA